MVRTYKVLVIGCGNIGAQYDMDNNEIQSHVKAWHVSQSVDLSIYDTNMPLAGLVAERYNCKIAKSIDQEILKNFDCVSICSPTDTHFKILKDALDAGVNTIICEKPISGRHEELTAIEEIYSHSNSKILVNYIRRFLPAFEELRAFIDSIKAIEEITNISVRYQRGFINNCSHAFDLIEYLTDSRIDLTNTRTFNLASDHFGGDPTLSLQANWQKVNFNVLGLSDVCFSHFEIDIYFKYYKIVIKNAGEVIEIYRAEKVGDNLQPLMSQPEFTRHNCLKNYMAHVTGYALKLMSRQVSNDNFISSVNLNKKMLEYKDN
jgi:predicted dehydrogenase